MLNENSTLFYSDGGEPHTIRSASENGPHCPEDYPESIQYFKYSIKPKFANNYIISVMCRKAYFAILQICRRCQCIFVGNRTMARYGSFERRYSGGV